MQKKLKEIALGDNIVTDVSDKLNRTEFSDVSSSFLTAHLDITNKLNRTEFSDVSSSFLTAHLDITNKLNRTEFSDVSSSFLKHIDNIDLKQIVLDQDLKFIGNYTLGTKKTTIDSVWTATKGMTLYDMLSSLFTGELVDENPEITLPSINLTATNGSFEYGSHINTSWNASFYSGNYSFGPATGLIPEWSITDYTGNIHNTNSGNLTIEKLVNSSYTLTATVSYNQGAMPITKLGKEYPAGRIQAGNKTVTKTISGYYGYFYGSLQGSAVLENIQSKITSNIIRGLSSTKSGIAALSFPTKYTLVEGDEQIIFACKSSELNATSTIELVDPAGFSTLTLSENFTKMINDASGTDEVEYRIFYADNKGAPATANITYNVQINK